jgi:hypothetical protein
MNGRSLRLHKVVSVLPGARTESQRSAQRARQSRKEACSVRPQSVFAV